MRIRNRKSFLTSLPEGSAPKSSTKQITKFLYFFILAAIILYLLWYGAGKMLYVEAPGQVVVGRHLINSPYGGIIDKIIVSPGTVVKKNQIIALLEAPLVRQQDTQKDFLRNRRDRDLKKAEISSLNTYLHELSRPESPLLPEKIIVNDHTLRLKKGQLAQLMAQQQATQNTSPKQGSDPRGRLLELSRVDTAQARKEQERERENRAAIEREITSLKENIASLDTLRQQMINAERRSTMAEIRLLKAEVAALYDYESGIQSQSDITPAVDNTIRSPADGTVQALFKREGEQAAAGEALLSLHTQSSKVFIHGYVDQLQLSALSKNKRVKIRFADGFRDEGLIANYYSIASPYLKPIHEGYRPIQPSILVEIVPVTSGHEEKWLRYDRMDVTIRLKK